VSEADEVKAEIKERYDRGDVGQLECGGHWSIKLTEDRTIIYSYWCCDGEDGLGCDSCESYLYNSFEEFDEDGWSMLDDYGIWTWYPEQANKQEAEG